MKKNIDKTFLYLLLSHLSFMAFAQLPSINPLPDEFKPVCRGSVDSIIEKRVFPDPNRGFKKYYFDNNNRLKNTINQSKFVETYSYFEDDTAEIIKLTESFTSSDMINLQVEIYRDCMGRYRKIITDRVYTDFIYDKGNRIIAYTILSGEIIDHRTIKYKDFLNRQIEISTPDYRLPLWNSYIIHVFNPKRQLIKTKEGTLTEKGRRILRVTKKIRYKNDKKGNWIYRKACTPRVYKEIEEREIYYRK